MLTRIREQMIRQDILHAGDRIVTGVSGGADSVCLLCVLSELRREFDLDLYAVHVHHGIRGTEADRDAAFTEALCRKLGVEYRIVYRDVPKLAELEGCSEEEMGRKLRYQVLEECRREWGCDWIAVAHNREDNAETILWNLCRGTGLTGLTGIRPVRDRIIRPLLMISREEIENWLAERGQEYCTDSTNLGEDYTRNRIRHRILPVLQEDVNRQSVRHITETGRRLAQLQDYLDRQIEKELQYVQRVSGSISWTEAAYRNCDEMLRSEVILRLMREVSGKVQDFTAEHVQQVSDLYGREVGKQIHLPYGLVVRRTYEGIVLEETDRKEGAGDDEVRDQIYALEPTSDQLTELLIPEAGVKIRYQILECTENIREIVKKAESSCTKWFDYDRICNTVVVRTRRTGDRLVIHPDGRSRKLKDYWIDRKVPREERARIWLLAAGSDVLWILGDRTGEGCRVEAQTRRVLMVQVEELPDEG